MQTDILRTKLCIRERARPGENLEHHLQAKLSLKTSSEFRAFFHLSLSRPTRIALIGFRL